MAFSPVNHRGPTNWELPVSSCGQHPPLAPYSSSMGITIKPYTGNLGILCPEAIGLVQGPGDGDCWSTLMVLEDPVEPGIKSAQVSLYS